MSPPSLRAASLAAPTIGHGFFGREGGVSTGLYTSLNCGLGSKDTAEAVAENRARIAQALGVFPDHLLTAYQVHSARAVFVDGPWRGARPEADGLVTTRPGLALGALAADCAPILLADAVAGVIGAAHAGWKGALAGIAEATVALMIEHGAARDRLVVAIGPCIGQASYEVGPEFLQRFEIDDAESARFFRAGRADRLHFDLEAYVALRLQRAGVTAIERLGADTCLMENTFFSNRRAHLRAEPDFGRNLSAIVMRP